MLKNNLFKISSYLLILAMLIAPFSTFAIDIFDPTVFEGQLSGYDSNYDGVSDIAKALKDPAAAKSLTSCSTVVSAAQRSVLGLQYAKQDPTRNDTLLTIFNNIPALIGGAVLTSQAFEDGKLTDENKKRWGNTWNAVTFGASNKNQTKKAEEAKDTDRIQELLEQEKFRTECLDSIKISIAKSLLDRGTAEMVSLIQTGDFGNPLYVTDGKQWLQQVQNRTIIDVFAADIRARENGQELSNPYALGTIKNVLSQNRSSSFQERTRFTLGDVLHNVQNRYGTNNGVNNTKADKDLAVKKFNDDFKEGGWEGWLALTQNPQNNPIGYAILTQEELEKKSQEQEKALIAENSNQLLSKKVCVSYIDEEGKTVNKKSLKVNPNDPKTCLKSEVVTPGLLITERMKWFTTSDIRQLELADKFNSSISQILTASVNKIAQVGLDAITKKTASGWDSGGFSGFNEYSFSRNNYFNGGRTQVTYQSREYELFLDTNNSFWTDQLNLNRDLNDFQLGCEVKKGLYNTQKEYVEELAYMKNPATSPLPLVVPYVAVLDMCVPGPTLVWQDLANPLFGEYIDAVSSQDPQQLGSPNLAFTKINNILNKREKTSGTMATVGSLTGSISSILPPPANGIGMMVNAGLNIGAALVKNKRIEGFKPEDYRNAMAFFQQIVPQAIEIEAYKNKDKEIQDTITAYESYIDYIYTTYSNANNLPVAAKARNVIGNIIEKDENINATMQAYNAEYANAVVILNELDSIKKEVDNIYTIAQKRMSDKYDTRDSNGNIIKWNDVSPICNQSCDVVKQPIKKPDLIDVNKLVSGLELKDGIWGSRKIISANVDNGGLFNNPISDVVSSGGTNSTGVPKIISFKIDDATLKQGQSTKLKWVVENASSVTLTSNTFSLPLHQSKANSYTLAITPFEDTKYILTVENGNLITNQTVSVKVID